MRRVLSRLALPLACYNVAWNLLLFALNPAWGSMVLAWVWLAVGSVLVIGRRWRRASHLAAITSSPTLQEINTRPVPVLTGSLRSSTIYLEPGERLIPLPDGWKRTETPRGTRYIRECSHWPRDEVKLSDGTTVAYICRRCDHDWVNEQWVLTP